MPDIPRSLELPLWSALPSMTRAEAVVTWLHNHGDSAYPHWGRLTASPVRMGLGWYTNTSGPRDSVGDWAKPRESVLIKHIILRIVPHIRHIVPNYATSSVRNVTKNFKGRSSSLETLFQYCFVTII